MREKTSEDSIYNFITNVCREQERKNGIITGCDTNYIAEGMKLKRSNVSAVLNKLCREEKLIKIKGKPVIYKITEESLIENKLDKIHVDEVSVFDELIGSEESLKGCILQAKAAIMYPPRGLHTLLLGETGVGKTLFAETIYKYAKSTKVLDEEAPFISFNCADYANNPQLLLSYLFGVKKGTYTGANEDREGIVEKANGGILFLDEIHRLPPEGQEVLFYLIDKGEYRPLGEVEKYKKVDLLIICATTEKKEKVLLSTFSRRIPMTIAIPSLTERTYKERFKLISESFYMEAKRVNREVVVTPEAIKSLLLYNCTGNVGQLMNDIQLGCANAFLSSMVNRNKEIVVDINQFPNHVKMGILNYKSNKKEIDKIVIEKSLFKFTRDREKPIETIRESEDSLITLYNNLENRMEQLKNRGLNKNDIYMIMSMDIDKYFKNYIYKISTDINKEEISKIVDGVLIKMVEDFMECVGIRLKRVFTKQIFYSLCLHISTSIERIKQGRFIVNHKLQEIQTNHSKEFEICLELAHNIEKVYEISIPKDEVAFITMFITEEYTNSNEYIDNKPRVLIAMHGESTATSMKNVVNRLLGSNNTYSYDMDLDKSTKEAYEEIKEIVRNIDEGSGVILLVDMGSLDRFGDLIYSETGIKVKVINMVSTLIAIEVARKALINNDIEEIYRETIDNIKYTFSYDDTNYNRHEYKKENIIVTLCITGEGAAVKLKSMIENNKVVNDKNIDIYAMSILDREDMLIKIKRLSNEKNIIAIVGSINPDIYGIPFVPSSELFSNKGFNKIEKLIDMESSKFTSVNKDKDDAEDMCGKIIEAFKGEIKTYDLASTKDELIQFIYNVEEKFGLTLNLDTIVGAIMHMISSIDRIKLGEHLEKYIDIDKLSIDKEEISKIKEILKPIEKKCDMEFVDDEIYYVYTLIKNL
ncbi:sigma-54-dependent transcriptional regulator [Clostridium paraputrificum]|uniref:sigma-54-dependent transcriptional regulator n=1 Tax=Clostridium paraputrificum TaxID=29363 RepID=UPI001B3C95AD|nr:sigma-54-dependent transcriptional regulator [Clostridium paraputrificum]